MMRRVVRILPALFLAVGACTLVLGSRFFAFSRSLQPSGSATTVSLDSYHYMTTASSYLTVLARDAGLALLVVGVALLLLAWLAAYWRKVSGPRTT